VARGQPRRSVAQHSRQGRAIDRLDAPSAAWQHLKRNLQPLRLRLGRDAHLMGGGGLICEVPIGPARPSPGVLRAGTVLRFKMVSHGAEDAASWTGPPAPVFAVEGGPSDGYLVGLYLE
jgi:hypothetical protein